ncbi:MAG: N-formylglutamate amidohydrolase [Opitutus sp.]|nr:N-formylglutamate amidohydrolase [Opitutus sp.]
MTPSDAPAPFVLQGPAGPTAPVIFDSPHSAIDYPEDFAPTASREAIRTTWDAFVDELFGHVPAAGATLLAARFPRAYIDANRAVSDIDPDLLETPWPEPVELSEHTRSGMGLIRRFALPGVPMYERKLSVAEVRRRIDRFFIPYRQALQTAIDAAWGRHGVVYHFNCHSMKSRGNAMNRDNGATRPDLVISDRDGSTAAPEFTAWVADYFARLGYEVKINDPYRGADIIRTHGQPARGRTSIQIELNRALYMNEATFQRGPGFAEVQDHLTAFARAVAERTRQAVA